jgi:levanase/fructan beta-fructosidase
MQTLSLGLSLISYQYPIAQTLPSGKSVEAEQQSQSMAYSLDDGTTWQTYSENPIIHYPPAPYKDQYKNFRDPFVFRHEQTNKWILVTTLSEIHKLVIWESDNLKDWTVASEFGPFNGVGGVWECPNLFPLPLDGDNTKWVMIVGMNPGGPPETVGSGTQYFVGEFNGTTFVPDADTVYPGNGTSNWMDWGPDFYAAAGYNGLPYTDHVSMGWMNNWQYGENIPTRPWRSAMATPRHLSLRTVGEKVRLVQQPRENWKSITSQKKDSQSWKSVEGMKDLGSRGKTLDIKLSFDDRQQASSGKSEFGIILQATSDLRQQTRVGYDFRTRKVFLDRRKSGDVSFDKTFASVYHAPLEPGADGIVHLRIMVDWSSVEVFGGQGETTMTAQIFPGENATYARLFSTGGRTQSVKLDISDLSSVWH